MQLILGNKNYSSWSLRGWLAAVQSGAPFSETVIPLDEPGYQDRIREYSPSGRVPALLVDEGVIWESMAIAEYLAERFPQAGLWPAQPFERARARTISHEMHAGFATLRRCLPMDFRAVDLPYPEGVGLSADIERVIELLSDTRRRFGASGPFLFGDFGIADAMFAPVMSRFHTYAVPLPAIVADYRDAVLTTPAMLEWGRAACDEPWTIHQ